MGEWMGGFQRDKSASSLLTGVDDLGRLKESREARVQKVVLAAHADFAELGGVIDGTRHGVVGDDERLQRDVAQHLVDTLQARDVPDEDAKNLLNDDNKRRE